MEYFDDAITNTFITFNDLIHNLAPDSLIL